MPCPDLLYFFARIGLLMMIFYGVTRERISFEFGAVTVALVLVIVLLECFWFSWYLRRK